MTDTNERAARIAAIRELRELVDDHCDHFTRQDMRTVLAEIERLEAELEAEQTRYMKAIERITALENWPTETATLRTERAAVAAAARRGDWGEVIRIIGWKDKS